MELPQGFLGTRGDILMDLVILSLVAVVPIVIYSWRLARQKQYANHKLVQITTAIVLGLAVLVFELNMQSLGGIYEATKESSYAGTATLNGWITVHSAFAETTALLWFILIIASIIKFPKPPAPNSFSGVHRFFGRIGMVVMLGTGVTAIPVYVYGFGM